MQQLAHYRLAHMRCLHLRQLKHQRRRHVRLLQRALAAVEHARLAVVVGKAFGADAALAPAAAIVALRLALGQGALVGQPPRRDGEAADQRRFLRHVVRYWDVHRHRIAPSVHAQLQALRERGQLQLHRGRIDAVSADGDHVRLTGDGPRGLASDPGRSRSNRRRR